MGRFLSTVFKPVSRSAQKLRRAILHPSSSKAVITIAALWTCILLAYCILQVPRYGRIRSFGESLSTILLPVIGVTIFSIFTLRGLPSISKKDTAIAKSVSELYAQGGYQQLHSAATELKEIKKPSLQLVATCAVSFCVALTLVGVFLGATGGTKACNFFIFLEASLVIAACAGVVGFLMLHHQSRVATALSNLSEGQVDVIVDAVRLEQIATKASTHRRM
ncbi:hypothetical protein [Neorickettsia sennetsu]|uniref:Uncharacterized protein n=1 Tax=Ehrlichia sennetsu (strain ATCC VR-367 / Miyayama) TaxID=222891 RepID=Q2GEW5_EHRS3|nr:hypothetical protein [Neorickettsia sennetsu]ABD46030.1 hypothetical protein NSE_0080 [Neorickettsia sennetsu str. Miyayama]